MFSKRGRGIFLSLVPFDYPHMGLGWSDNHCPGSFFDFTKCGSGPLCDESQQRTALKEIIKHFCTYRQRSSRQDLEMVLEYKIGQLKLSGPF